MRWGAQGNHGKLPGKAYYTYTCRTEFRKLYISVTTEKYRVKGDTGKLGDSEKV